MIENRVELAKKIIVEAGRILDESFKTNVEKDFSVKPDKSFVTEKDKEIEKFLVDAIKAKFPEDGFLGEEGANIEGGSNFSWIIDPIDGTSNFIYKIPLYSISIGITQSGFIEAGVVYLPSLSKLYSVQKGGGFTSEKRICKISDTSKLSEAFTIFSIAHKAHLRQINQRLYPVVFNRVRKVRILGSTSTELTFVASGSIDMMIAVGVSPWDVAGGVLMVREAGGIVVDFEGNDWQSESKTLIAGNKMIVNEMVELVKRNNISF